VCAQHWCADRRRARRAGEARRRWSDGARATTRGAATAVASRWLLLLLLLLRERERERERERHERERELGGGEGRERT
jgi:hypothetical protein